MSDPKPDYRVELVPAARRQLAKLPQPARGRVEAGLRVRVGDYRAVYRVDDGARLVEVLGVGHRREVYRR